MRRAARTLEAARQEAIAPPEPPEEIDRQVGRRLRSLRMSSGWSLDDLAARLGIERLGLENYESGESPVLPRHLYELSRIAEVGVEWFFMPPAQPGRPIRMSLPRIAPSVAQEAALLVKYVQALSPATRGAFLNMLCAAQRRGAGRNVGKAD